MVNKKPELEILTWKDVRNDIQKINPTFAQAIDDLNPSKEYSLLKVKYPFGQHILDHGILQIPNAKNELVHIHDDSVNSEVKKKLNYAPTIPMGIVLNNSLELYLTVNARVIPFAFMIPGKIFSLWGVLQPPGTSAHTGKVWNITSGARSLMMLPKISDITNYKNLKRNFGLHSPVPKALTEQWDVFVELANHPDFAEPWSADVLFFSGKWLENYQDKEWRLFRAFLMETAWTETIFLRNQIMFDFVYSCALSDRNLKPNPYLSDTVRHLSSISAGNFPGFKISQDNIAGPVGELQKIFIDLYGLRYAPTMIHPGYLSYDTPLHPVYYSLEVPTIMEFSPKSRQISSKLEDLREIHHILDTTRKELLKDKFGFRDTPIFKLVSSIDYEYFHTDVDRYGSVKHTREMIKKNRTLQLEAKKYKNLPFCESSSFVRGCIEISTKSEHVSKNDGC